MNGVEEKKKRRCGESHTGECGRKGIKKKTTPTTPSKQPTLHQTKQPNKLPKPRQSLLQQTTSKKCGSKEQRWRKKELGEEV
ncbi:MAG: hypothetical protein PUE12_02345 [Oscillospiraceae bacterium]|nr:hypothetical protein [Oscillospiraceae bacterium]